MDGSLRISLLLSAAFATFFCGAFVEAGADDVAKKPTFTRDVAPILFDNCVSCHRAGEIAPMSLRTFDEARPWAKSIREKVSSREMPPWFADPAHGVFSNDARLTAAEIETITRWVDQGARRGDAKDMPDLPVFTDGWQRGEPDFIINLPEVTVPATGPDYFPDLSFTTDVPEGNWVNALEIRPSNREVAHHVVIFGSGFGSGGGGMSNFDVLGVWAVGSPPTVYPEGMGRRIEPGQRFMTNMHYHPNGVEQIDKTQMGLYFGEGELEKEIETNLQGSFTLSIPPGEANHGELSSWYVDDDIKVVSFFPHMHLRGKDMSFKAVYPDGREQILLSVPKYDFDWQLFYYPEEEILLPKGTRIDLAAHYDNSAGNPNNPDPTRTVGFGTDSTDEMMFGLFEFYYEDDAEARVAMTDVDRLRLAVESMPQDEMYSIEFDIAGMKMPSMLHLPPEGAGEWIVSFQGTQLKLPTTNIVWQGDAFSFDMTLRFGEMGGDFKVKGAVNAAGGIAGDFKMSGEGMALMSHFEGTLAALDCGCAD